MACAIFLRCVFFHGVVYVQKIKSKFRNRTLKALIISGYKDISTMLLTKRNSIDVICIIP
jgi:hypothetical protein